MQLAELLKDWPCVTKGSIRIAVTGIDDYAQAVQSGYIYVARKGKKFNGQNYIEQAIEKGASAIVVDDEAALELKLAVPIIWVPNCMQFLSYASAKLQHFPAEALTVIAVTGTNGKTTVTHFISQLLGMSGKSCIVIGTNGVFLNGVKQATAYESLTTLQAKHLHEAFRTALQNGAQYAVLEASSMGLANYRLDDCAIDVGVFLNLSSEHIEDHGSLEQYKKAKQRLAVISQRVVVNGDDPFSRNTTQNLKKKKVIFGSKGRVDFQWQLLTSNTVTSTCFVQYANNEYMLEIPFAGEFQLQNVIAAYATLHCLGLELKPLFDKCGQLTLPRGRMQEVDNQKGIRIIIDYAHTPQALKEVLQTFKKQKIRLVFSCGGERDQDKRKKMGVIASTYAHKVYLTTDNARSEKPSIINAQIKEGFYHQQLYEEIEDRALAIKKALQDAQLGDIVLIVGKGHEETQTIGGKTIYFSDEACVQDFLTQSEETM